MLFRKSLQVGGCESPENIFYFTSVLSSVANQEAWNAFESDGFWGDSFQQPGMGGRGAKVGSSKVCGLVRDGDSLNQMNS